jgi:hypothetical protein
LSRSSTEKEIIMSRFPGNARVNDLRLPRIIFGSLALVALVATAPVSSAFAQVPHDMLLLDPPQPQPTTKTLVMTKDPHARNAYARSRKAPAH